MLGKKFISIPFRLVLLLSLILPAIHFCLAKLMLSVAFENGIIPIWPSVGIYLASVTILGLRISPALVLSELIFNSFLFSNDKLQVVLMAVANLIDPLLIGLFFYRSKQQNLFDCSKKVFKFVILTLAVPLLAASFGCATLCLTGNVLWSEYGTAWQGWYIADVGSLLIVTPFLLVWFKCFQQRLPFFKRQLLEYGVLFGLVLLIGWASFAQDYGMEYLVIPLLIWSAFRFELRESTLLVVVVAAIAAWGTVRGSGSFVRPNVMTSLMLLQCFISVLPITVLFMSALIAEKTDAALNLKKANEELEDRVEDRTKELKQTLKELKKAQTYLIQSEKMSSLGQLVGGIAHEINNPVSFIYGNIAHANEYIQDLLQILRLYQHHYPKPVAALQSEIEAMDVEFLAEDLPKLFGSMKVGANRIQQIVQSLRVFSRLDEAELKLVDIHEGIDSTLTILENRFKQTSKRPAISLIKQYSNLPLIECYAGELNQVFFNILTNAIDALDKVSESDPHIIIRTQIAHAQQIAIHIVDNGEGIPVDIQKQIFDPFFTTKQVGKGTGMGLAISYQTVTERHCGLLDCISQLGKGTEFVITIPLKQN